MTREGCASCGSSGTTVRCCHDCPDRLCEPCHLEAGGGATDEARAWLEHMQATSEGTTR